MWAARYSFFCAVEICSTCTRAPVSCAIVTRRCVAFRAAISSRQMGCERASPSIRRFLRSFRRGSSSAWNAARRRMTLSTARRPASSATSSEPVDEPMNTLMPAQPGSRSSSARCLVLSTVAPTKNAKSQCMRCCPRLTLSASVSALTVSGSVLGISNTAVTPPITADSEPLSRSSLCVRPGSRKWTWVSITPGRRCSPRQSITSAADARDKVADRLKTAAANAEIAHPLAVMVDDRAAFEDQIVGVSHARRCRGRA